MQQTALTEFLLYSTLSKSVRAHLASQIVRGQSYFFTSIPTTNDRQRTIDKI